MFRFHLFKKQLFFCLICCYANVCGDVNIFETEIFSVIFFNGHSSFIFIKVLTIFSIVCTFFFPHLLMIILICVNGISLLPE
jgi:hypothetical protein